MAIEFDLRTFEKRSVGERLGIDSLQAHQLAGIDHVESHLLQPPLQPAQREEARAREFGRKREHPHLAHEVGTERQLKDA